MKDVLSPIGIEKTGYLHEEDWNSIHFLTLFKTQIWVKDLNVRPKTYFLSTLILNNEVSFSVLQLSNLPSSQMKDRKNRPQIFRRQPILREMFGNKEI
jgi:hypothetical protein